MSLQLLLVSSKSIILPHLADLHLSQDGPGIDELVRIHPSYGVSSQIPNIILRLKKTGAGAALGKCIEYSL